MKLFFLNDSLNRIKLLSLRGDSYVEGETIFGAEQG